MRIEPQDLQNRSPGFKLDEIRTGEPAVLDIENLIEARIEINFDPDRPVHLRDILVTIFDLGLKIDPSVTMGSFDGAEICELVGLFILNELKRRIPEVNFGLYRDDGLGDHQKMSSKDFDKTRCYCAQ